MESILNYLSSRLSHKCPSKTVFTSIHIQLFQIRFPQSLSCWLQQMKHLQSKKYFSTFQRLIPQIDLSSFCSSWLCSLTFLVLMHSMLQQKESAVRSWKKCPCAFSYSVLSEKMPGKLWFCLQIHFCVNSPLTPPGGMQVGVFDELPECLSYLYCSYIYVGLSTRRQVHFQGLEMYYAQELEDPDSLLQKSDRESMKRVGLGNTVLRIENSSCWVIPVLTHWENGFMCIANKRFETKSCFLFLKMRICLPLQRINRPETRFPIIHCKEGMDMWSNLANLV